MNVLVTGATGTVGAHVVRALRERGVMARAFVRDREKAASLLGEDVEVAVGDFADRSSIERALRGTEALFLACGNVPGQIEHESAVIDAANAAGVQRVVKLSGPRAAADSPLLFERWHGEIERRLLGSGLPSVMLRPSAYMTNLLAYAEAIAQPGKLFAPAGAAEIAYVDPRDVAAAAAAALVTAGHEGNAYPLTGPEAITYERIAQELSAATGRGIEYVDVPGKSAREAMLQSGLPAMMADVVVDVFASYRAGSQASTTDGVRALTGREPGTFAQFARDHATLFGAATSAQTNGAATRGTLIARSPS
jgi:uncharacterized protein YbjT (DUF2867 family)